MQHIDACLKVLDHMKWLHSLLDGEPNLQFLLRFLEVLFRLRKVCLNLVLSSYFQD